MEAVQRIGDPVYLTSDQAIRLACIEAAAKFARDRANIGRFEVLPLASDWARFVIGEEEEQA